MAEIIPYIILILVLLVLELIQIVWAKSKIKKWILPILAFLFSIYMTAFLVLFELSDTLGPVENNWTSADIGTLMMFPILNIPTIMFIITNVIVKKSSCKTVKRQITIYLKTHIVKKQTKKSMQ